MTEYISRKAAIEALSAEVLERNLDSVMTDDAHRYHRAAERVIAGVPAADVRPVVRGKWRQTKDEFGIYNKCSACGKEYYCGPIAPFYFCPNCGADMREEGVTHG